MEHTQIGKHTAFTTVHRQQAAQTCSLCYDAKSIGEHIDFLSR